MRYNTAAAAAWRTEDEEMKNGPQKNPKRTSRPRAEEEVKTTCQRDEICSEILNYPRTINSIMRLSSASCSLAPTNSPMIGRSTSERQEKTHPAGRQESRTDECEPRRRRLEKYRNVVVKSRQQKQTQGEDLMKQEDSEEEKSPQERSDCQSMWSLYM